MERQPTCTACGTLLGDGATSGLCPACLVRVAFQPESHELDPAGPRTDLDSGLFGDRGRTFGDYELLEEIARGGMGVVFKARQRSLNRIVALKMILAGEFAGKEFVQRFRGEAATAAVLRHPNIVAVHEVGIHKGQHYFSMDYVEGKNLAELVGHQPLASKQAARYLESIARAIHYAHEQGVLHRDLKPSNILVDAATDQPHITDFGLAKRLDGQSGLTVTGQMLGSPNFMPPEQASRARGKVGQQSDVYGLGAVLYYLLTARAPFQAESLEALIQQVLNAEPVAPRLLNPSISPDVETVCLKCLEKEPLRRYSTSKELAEELGRFLRDEPIRAHPISRLERARRWGRRNPTVTILGGATAVLLLLLTIGAPIGLIRISHERNLALEEKKRVEQSRYVSDMNVAAEAWNVGNLRRARELLREHEPASMATGNQSGTVGFEWRLLWGLSHEEQARYTLNTGRAEATIVAVSPNGKYLAWNSPDAEHIVRLFDLAAGRELTSLSRHAGGVSSLTFSKEDHWLISGSGDGVMRRWNLDSWREEILLSGAGGAVEHITALEDPNRLLFVDAQAVKLLDSATGQAASLMPRPPSLQSVSGDGTLMAAWGNLENTVRFWQVGNQRPELASLPLQKGIILALAFSPGSRTAVISAHDSSVTLWDLDKMTPIQWFWQKGMINHLAISGGGEVVASADYDNLIKLWDKASGRPVRTLRGHTNGVTYLQFSRDGQTLVSVSPGTIKVWDSRVDQETNVLRHQSLVLNISVSRNGKVLASSDPNSHTISVWDVASQTLLYTNTRSAQQGRATVAVSPDARWLAAGWFTDGTLELLDMSTNPFRPGPTNVMQSVYGFHLSFSPDSRLLAFQGPNGMVHLWDLSNLKLAASFPNPARAGQLCATAFAAHRRILATSVDRDIRLWEINSGRLLTNLSVPRGGIWTLSFSPAGDLLAAGGEDPIIRLWNLSDPLHIRPLAPLVGHTANARAVAFSADGRTLATGSFDATVRLWSMALYKEVATFREHFSEVQSVTFSADGNALFTGSGDGTIRIWKAPGLSEIADPAANLLSEPR